MGGQTGGIRLVKPPVNELLTDAKALRVRMHDEEALGREQ